MVKKKEPKQESSWIVVCFFTKNTPYEDVANKYLIKSLEKLGIFHVVYEVLNNGDWLENIAYKPEIILKAMNKFPDKDIVYLDADSIVCKYPDLFDKISPEIDIAYHLLDWDTWYCNNTGHKEVFNSTIFLRNNEQTKEFVGKWMAETIDSPKTGEHLVFDELIKQDMKNHKTLNHYNLPLTYAYINSMPNGTKPNTYIKNPVITCYQKSRELRYKL